MDALSRKVDSRFDIELISSESPKYFMLAISTKRKIILELLSVYDLTLAQPKKKFTLPLGGLSIWIIKISLINPSLEDQWFQGHVQYVGITVIPCTLNYQLMFILIWRLDWGAEVLFSKNRKKMIRLMYTFCTWRGLT